jgi:hypothetical protein
LGDILIGSGYLMPDALEAALASRPLELRLGEHLVNTGRLSPETLYEALSLQQGLAMAQVEPALVPPAIARVLPERVVRDWKVLPFRVADGSLYLAGPEIPTAETTVALRPFTALELRFHLITPAAFQAAFEQMLGALL